jgi:hypothetical protein
MVARNLETRANKRSSHKNMQTPLHPANQPKKKQPAWRQYWYVWFFAAVFLAFAAAYVLRVLTPPKQPPAQENTWKGITPGKSSLQDIQQKLGPPIDQQQTPEGLKLKYQSTYPTLPNEVTVQNGSTTVTFIKEFVDFKANEKLQDYITKYGQYDLNLFDQESGFAVRAYVFLKQGVVIIAHSKDGSVEQKWYFEPTTKELFLQFWGKDLLENDQEVQ